MDRDKQQLSIEAARLYYLSDYSQQEIAKQLDLSRPTVSRLLQYAKEKGYVQITVMDPFEDLNELSLLLKENMICSRLMWYFHQRTIIQRLRIT